VTDKGEKRYNKAKAKPANVVFKASINEIKDPTFTYSQIKSKKWITSRKKFIEYAGTTHGGDAELSLEEKELTFNYDHGQRTN
jgi:hypothetical protein